MACDEGSRAGEGRPTFNWPDSAKFILENIQTVILTTEVLKYSPNIHTSLAEVKRRKLIDSGAIHLIGNFPLEAGRLILESKTSLLSA